MAGRPRRYFYCFISNRNQEYYRCEYSNLGLPIVTANTSPLPIKYNPAELDSMQPELATNKSYFSLNRAITNPFKFIKDGADILRFLDYTGRGYEQENYFTVIKYNSETGVYELYYTGKFDFSQKNDSPLTNYTINTVDSGVWGVLSQRDDIQVQIPCNQTNPRAIKVLFDGITLKARYYYKPVDVATALDSAGLGFYVIIPLAYSTNDGDSFGLRPQTQEYEQFVDDMSHYVDTHTQVFFFSTQYATTINLNGPLEFDLISHNDTSFNISFYIWRSTYKADFGIDNVWEDPAFTEKLYYQGFLNLHDTHFDIKFDVNRSYDLADGERLILVCRVGNNSITGEHISITLTPKDTNLVVSTTTKIIPTSAYALRPLDLAQQIVSRVTGGLFTVHSDYYTVNNKVVCTCGDALRGESGAYIQTTFSDWFRSYDSGDFLAGRMIAGELWIEKWDEVYQENGEILEIGEINDLSIKQDTEHILANFEIGSPQQDYRRSSGRLEFNDATKFSFEAVDVTKNNKNLVSIYRRDGYGAEFMRLDYFDGNTKDNSGDKQTFMIDITDELGEANTLVPNYKIYQVDHAPLAPIITSPLSDDTITYPSPRIRGIAPPGSTINIYVDSVFDGTTTSDSQGNWDYNLVAVLDPYEISGTTLINTGIHRVEATFSDLSGETSAVNFTILSGTTLVSVVYPADTDHLIDNKPLIRGRGQRGQVLDIKLDLFIDLGTVTVDNSCWWEIQSIVLYNGQHGIQVFESGTELVFITFYTDTNTTVPVIIHPTEQFTLIDNTPLVEGVATPGSIVNVYLDYYSGRAVGTTTADGQGNWSIQIINLFKLDNVTVLTPIPDGEHTLSTGLTIEHTPVLTTGFKLNRPAFDEITGVYDNTVFNVMLSPKRMLFNRASYWSALMIQNADTKIQYGGNDKNQALRTLIDGIEIRENADVLISSLGLPGFLPILANFKATVPNTFNDVFKFFNHGGVIKASYLNNDLWFLPIGTMTVNDVTRNVQTWSLLISRRTPFTTLLNLSRSGLTLNLMTNAIHHSDYNSLHFVKYDFHLHPNYHALELYDDYFEVRNDRWFSKPKYLQKWQTNDTIRDQIVSNNVADAVLTMHRCSDAVQIALFPYNPVTPTPIPPPDVVQEVEIDFSLFDEGTYFFVLHAGGNPVAISEKIQLVQDLPETILIQAANSSNFTGFMYSTGIVSKLRIEGLVEKWQPNISLNTNTDEIGDNQMLHSVFSKKRRILLGKASGLPDYLYLKASAFVILDTLYIEGINYVADRENGLQEQDRVLGYPMYHYELLVELAQNQQSLVMGVGESAEVNAVTLVVDPEAFGFGGSELINIELNGE